jgi:hypothetical protein
MRIETDRGVNLAQRNLDPLCQQAQLLTWQIPEFALDGVQLFVHPGYPQTCFA